MRGVVKPLLLTVVVAGALIALLVWKPAQEDRHARRLLVYCAAGAKNPVAEVAARYEEEYDVRIELQYGGSGRLLSNLRVARTGDLYLAADTSYIRIAREQGLIEETVPLAKQKPVIAVRKGNPAGIRGVDDLLSEDVRISLADPRAASIGKQTMLLLKSIGKHEAVEQAATERGVFKPTVNEVANDVKLGAATAGITWDTTVNQYPDLESVPIAGSEDFLETVTVAVLSWTEKPTAALTFARYLGARDRGLEVFSEMGFPPVEGDLWEETP